MPSWLELVLNIIGYGGFLVLASRGWPDAADGAPEDARQDKA